MRTKKELFKSISTNEDLPQHQVRRIYEYILHDIQSNLLELDRHSINNLGTFNVVTRAARTIKSPLAGVIIVEPRKTIVFRPSPDFKRILNEKK